MTSRAIEINNILGQIFENIPVGAMLLNNNGELTYINKYARELLDVKGLNKPLNVLCDRCSYLFNRIIKLSEKQSASEFVITDDSNPLCLELFINTIEFNNISDKLIIFINKSEDIKKLDLEKAMQDELLRFKNLAAIGTMISGVAHELNNPIAGISMSSQLTESSLFDIKEKIDALESSLQEELNVIQESIDYALSEIGYIKQNSVRAARLIGDLLNYSKKEKLELQHTNLKEIIDETIDLTRYQSVFMKTRINIDCPPDIKLNCDKLKVQQVFYNILKNAAEAVYDAGMIQISCKSYNNHVTISIYDNGCGIPEINLKQLFIPFFTTKSTKGCTGLGLSISNRIIERHGGKITANSNINEGSEFIISLPTNLE